MLEGESKGQQIQRPIPMYSWVSLPSSGLKEGKAEEKKGRERNVLRIEWIEELSEAEEELNEPRGEELYEARRG